MAAAGIARAGLPLVVVEHPVGDPDESVVRRRGEAVAQECVRVLCTPAATLAGEFEARQYPLPAVMPR